MDEVEEALKRTSNFHARMQIAEVNLWPQDFRDQYNLAAEVRRLRAERDALNKELRLEQAMLKLKQDDWIEVCQEAEAAEQKVKELQKEAAECCKGPGSRLMQLEAALAAEGWKSWEADAKWLRADNIKLREVLSAVNKWCISVEKLDSDVQGLDAVILLTDKALRESSGCGEGR